MLHNSDLNNQENPEKNQSSSQEKFWTPFDNIIPSLLLEEKGVKGNHIRLYGLIRSLSQKYGYCFASNQRLAATLNCHLRNIQKLLCWLQKRGYIDRQDNGDEFNPERHIYLLDPRQKILTRGRKVTFTRDESSAPKEKELCQKILTRGVPVAGMGGCPLRAPKEEELKKENKEIEAKETGGKPPLAPDGAHSVKKIQKTKKEEKKEIAPRVWVTFSQHESLLKKANEDKKLTMSWYTKLSDWKISEDVGGGKSDYYRILKWVIKAVAKDMKKESMEDKKEDVMPYYARFCRWIESCRDPCYLNKGELRAEKNCFIHTPSNFRFKKTREGLEKALREFFYLDERIMKLIFT